MLRKNLFWLLIPFIIILTCSLVFAKQGKETSQLVFNKINIIVDGILLQCKDKNGKIIEPVLYNNSVYVPVASIVEATGKTVRWDGATKTVYIDDGNALTLNENKKDADAENAIIDKSYTGIIINAANFNLVRDIAPAIKTADGNVVWDGSNVSTDLLDEIGGVGYACSIDEAKTNNRIGDKPMIINAVGITGKARTLKDIVISDEDAVRILLEDKKQKMLDKLSIVIIYSRG